MRQRLPLPDVDPELIDLVLNGEPSDPLKPERRIFVNRHLRMDSVQHVGFDLDYTLAVYHKLPIETVQFQMSLKRLVNRLGYPKQVAQISYDPQQVIRGLVVDKKLGNLLKMDAHGHVGRAYHGRQPLARERRHRYYRSRRIRLSANRYASLDTLFAIPEGALYASLVDFFDRRQKAGKPIQPVAQRDGSVSYEKLFIDVRESIDAIHADGSLKEVIGQNVSKFIAKDLELSPMLHKLRSAGKKLFLLTNSALPYTQVVMSYLLDGVAEEYPTWRNYFDLVVVDAAKPAFFKGRNPFLLLDSEGNPKGMITSERFEREAIYARGNIRDFERLAGAYGDQVLYAGDHIYGDILRSKKDSLWRTALITPEIEEEVARQVHDHADFEKLSTTHRERLRIDDEINELKSFGGQIDARMNRFQKRDRRHRLGSLELRAIEGLARDIQLKIDEGKRRLKHLSQQIEELEDVIEQRFNPAWGRVFKEGHEPSRYGGQVEDYACIYTGRITNFAYYSPLHYFRAPLYLMAHEQAETS